MSSFLDTPIEFLKGVGPQRSELLSKELGIRCFKDLLHHFPFRYEDRSVYNQVREVPSIDGPIQLKGKLVSLQLSGTDKSKRLSGVFEDETGRVGLVWFKGIQWIVKSLKPGLIYQLYGKPKNFGGTWTVPHPELTEWVNVDAQVGWQGVYSSTEKLNAKGLHTKGLQKLTATLIDQINGKIPETLSPDLISRFALLNNQQAYRQIHHPTSIDDARKAITRFKFEELFYLQMEMLQRKQISFEKGKGFVFESIANYFTRFYEEYLPFELTGAQKRVVREIRGDVKTGKHMNRLLQGDVGSGKTLVALMTMLMALDNNFQAALMAPTEILANQHFDGISKLLEPLGIKTALLTGSVKKARRDEIHEALRSGELHILIGTHALLEKDVRFLNLGVVVIDEQHRFGVAQRAKMWRKNVIPPHILIMTATPIPRTLAMTFYGDLDVSTIDELPPGRKPITTVHRNESQRLKVFGFIRDEIAKGRQVYIVYPLIQESETLDLNNLLDGHAAISKSFPRPQYQVSMVHGKMKPAEKDFEMQRFIKGETQILVATTVIEVGVNVPNASLMIVENAERFGLSQLHQLRGRVGRGAEQSFCILMSSFKLSNDAKKRIQTMVRTNDGFEIAEADLKLRGPGDVMGTQQSGDLPLQLADLSRDAALVTLTRDCARKLLTEDPSLQRPENIAVKTKLDDILRSRPNWGKIA
jgi:ATP-dependent DNA helicase RecG